MKIELHITCHSLRLDEIEVFEGFCHSIECKPIVILLAEGEHQQQPMISKLLDCSTKKELKKEVAFIIEKFESNGYKPVRVKMEVPPWERKNAVAMMGKDKGNYFEWHGKINIEAEQKIDSLLAECMGHLSKNVLKKNPLTKFITIRDYTAEQSITRKVNHLKRALLNNNISLIKEELEYCIFDSNISLDKGWIQ